MAHQKSQTHHPHSQPSTPARPARPRPHPDQECEKGAPPRGSWRSLHQRGSVQTLPKPQGDPGRASEGRSGPWAGRLVQLEKDEGKQSVFLSSPTSLGELFFKTRKRPGSEQRGKHFEDGPTLLRPDRGKIISGFRLLREKSCLVDATQAEKSP